MKLFAAAGWRTQYYEQINAQLQRMLIDDQSMETVTDFFTEWLQANSRPYRAADRHRLREAMAEQTSKPSKNSPRRSSLAEVMAMEPNLDAQLLAEHYGIKKADGWVDGAHTGTTDPCQCLTTYALADGSSPVHRGVRSDRLFAMNFSL